MRKSGHPIAIGLCELFNSVFVRMQPLIGLVGLMNLQVVGEYATRVASI
jgi:hypothetical protein